MERSQILEENFFLISFFVFLLSGKKEPINNNN